MQKRLSVICVMTTVVLCGAFLACVAASPALREERLKFQAITTGMTETTVRTRLGEPKHRYRRDDAPTPYYVPGYQYKERPISASVLIYVGIESILYVYLDPAGNVEEVYVGGS